MFSRQIVLGLLLFGPSLGAQISIVHLPAFNSPFEARMGLDSTSGEVRIVSNAGSSLNRATLWRVLPGPTPAARETLPATGPGETRVSAISPGGRWIDEQPLIVPVEASRTGHIQLVTMDATSSGWGVGRFDFPTAGFIWRLGDEHATPIEDFIHGTHGIQCCTLPLVCAAWSTRPRPGAGLECRKWSGPLKGRFDRV